MMKFIFLLVSVILVNKLRRMWWFMVMGITMVMLLLLMESPSMEEFHFYSSEWGYDFMGFSLIILSYWISILMISSSWMVKKMLFFQDYFIWLVLFLLMVLELCFMSMNLLFFYVFFEISLIPTLLIIMGWGFQLERLQAGVYFMFYTLTASLPLLLNLLSYFNTKGLIHYLANLSIKEMFQTLNILESIIMLSLITAFLVKLPIFFIHLWLPKAHVEAPVAGSMILAGVLLKLGGFGLCRVMPLVMSSILKFNSWMISLGLMSMIYVGFMCSRLNDLKALVAYSSVSHMGLVFSGLVTMSSWGISGALIMMVSHGLSSSGLFCVVNMFYERLSSRSIYLNKGLLILIPTMSLMVFFLCAANISAPPTVNLMGEIFLMVSVMSFSKIMMILFPLGSFLGAVFTLFMFSYTQHGKNYIMGMSFLEGKMNEYHSLMLHIIPLNFLVVKSEMFFL